MIFFVLFFSHLINGAVDSQFAHFMENERRELNGPYLIGSEYQSDRLTYQFLNEWNDQWLRDHNQFQYTAGSLGPTRFYTHGRGKFSTPLTDSMTFRLTYFDNGELTHSRSALIFEFLYQLNSWWKLSVYGEPDTLKSEDDIGFASHFLFLNHEVRLFYTAVDFSHNKRTEDNSRYDKSPVRWVFLGAG